MLRGDAVDEHVLGRDDDDLAEGEHQHRQAPDQQRLGQRESQQADQEQRHAGDQPGHQLAAADAPANHILQGNHRHRVGRHQVADVARRFAGAAGHHQVLRQVGGELAEHYRTEGTAEGEADQPAVFHQLHANTEKPGLFAAFDPRPRRALAPAPVAQAHGQAEQRREQKRQVIIQQHQRHADEGPDRVGDVAQGVLDREHFAALLQRQQRAKAGLGGDVHHRQGQVDQHQADEEQAQLAADHRANEGQGKGQGRGDDHRVAAQGIDQVAAIQAQQGGDDQRAADHQADAADVQGEVLCKVDHQVGQGDRPGQGQGEGGRQQQTNLRCIAFDGGEH
ncbi:hypothetical protein D3C77_195990 [compost metagenome]